MNFISIARNDSVKKEAKKEVKLVEPSKKVCLNTYIGNYILNN